MHIDARDYDGPPLKTDICVVGGGAAGISLARELVASGLHCTVVESGGLERGDDYDALNDAESPGIEGGYLQRSRVRVLGGTTNHWTGMCLPLAPSTFGARPWVAPAGWPVDRDTMTPWYDRACDRLGLGRWSTDGTTAHDETLSPLPLPDLQTRVYQILRRFDFAAAFGELLGSSPTTTVLTHATATGLAHEGAKVSRLKAQTLDGKTLHVDARAFVLATGGIENARQLLLAPSLPLTGRDNVGRYYMDHPELTVAEALLWPGWDLDLYLGGRLTDDRPGFGGLFVDPAAQREHELRQIGFQLRRANRRWGSAGSRAADREVAGAAFWFDCGRQVRDEACVPSTQRASVFARCEQSPDRDNRVVLGERTDAFGRPIPRLHWRLGADDYRSIAGATSMLGRRLSAAGLGRMRSFVPADPPDELRTIYGPSSTSEDHDAVHEQRRPLLLVWGHHMGTTRMAREASDGVVDDHCRVHGVDNLFVAGSSVFPTGGAANPTLTIVALALRLAEHLRASFG